MLLLGLFRGWLRSYLRTSLKLRTSLELRTSLKLRTEFFSLDNLDGCFHSLMRQLAVLQVEQQQEQWAALHAELAAACPACRVTAEQLTWAVECVFSRAFSGPYSGSPLARMSGKPGTAASPFNASTSVHRLAVHAPSVLARPSHVDTSDLQYDKRSTTPSIAPYADVE